MNLILMVWLAAAVCIGRPSPTLRGWNEISSWTLPGDRFGVVYACAGANRKIVLERFGSRTGPEARFVSDLLLPKLTRGEVLIEGGQCTNDGAADPYIVPFGTYSSSGRARVRHAWRVDLSSGNIVSVNSSSVKCEASNEKH